MGVRSLAFAAVAALAALSLACNGGSEDTSGTAPPDGQVHYIDVRWASGQARDLDSLIAATGTVFVGTVTGMQPQRQEAASEGGATFPITAYRVSVVDALVGDPAAEVLVEQVAGSVSRADGSQTRVLLQGDEFIQEGETYLFFSARKDNGAYTSPPFARFTIDSDGNVSVPSRWANGGVALQLAGDSIEAAAAEVRAHAD